MGGFGQYQRYLRDRRKAFEIHNDLVAAQKSTGALLREQREEAEEAERLANQEPLPEDATPQGPRPDPRAQWDEKQACWVVWSAEAGDWVPHGEPSGGA